MMRTKAESLKEPVAADAGELSSGSGSDSETESVTTVGRGRAARAEQTSGAAQEG